MIRFLSILVAFLVTSNMVWAQCNINACAGGAILSGNAPVFDQSTLGINVDNVTFGNITCSSGTYVSGIDMYLYQLLPDGTRMTQCNTLNGAPDNIIGKVSVTLGQLDLCGTNFNIGSLEANASNGFNVCDGAVYEVELVLYTTTNTSFSTSSLTTYSQLSTSEFTTVNLGTVEAAVTGTFPAGTQPLTTAVLEEWGTGNSGTITVDCTDDVDLYAEGLSMLGDCAPYGDYSISVPSELENTFSYSINGGPAVVIQNSGTGAAGGQQTGPDAALGGNCYSGILTAGSPYTFAASNVPNVCNGATVVFTIITTDLYTGQTVSDQLTVIYQGNNTCPVDLFENGSPIASGLYQASNSVVSSSGSVTGGNVIFDAGNCVQLNSGFEVTGGDFEAKIGGCNP